MQNLGKIVYFFGDNHGQWNEMFFILERISIENCVLIHMGDGGEGFTSHEATLGLFKTLNQRFKEKGIEFFSPRGNHSNKKYFDGSINYSNFKLVPDNSVISIEGKNILFLGGGISIDRYNRIPGVNYWHDENFVLDSAIFKHSNIDIVVSHLTPLYLTNIPPTRKSNFVLGWAQRDVNLLKDLKKEQDDITAAFTGLLEFNPITNWYGGHYHNSYITKVENYKKEICTVRILAIDEIVEHNE